MKLMIASDIHGSALYCAELLEAYRREGADKLLLLGDLLYHGPRNDLPRDYAPKQVIEMLSRHQDIIVAVRGNCEAEVDQMVLPFPCMADFARLEVDGITFHLTHGHHDSPDKLPQLPEGSVFLSGHTHIKMDEHRQGIRCLNTSRYRIDNPYQSSSNTTENTPFS